MDEQELHAGRTRQSEQMKDKAGYRRVVCFCLGSFNNFEPLFISHNIGLKCFYKTSYIIFVITRSPRRQPFHILEQ